MEYEEDYKMWLEEMFIKMNPDWICDGMTGKELTHDWCEKYCGKDSDYLTPKCLHMYYHHIAMADRKTEPQTHEIHTNTHECVKNTHDKDEPKICDTCRYYNSNIPCGTTPSACKKADKFAEEFVAGLKKLEPKTDHDRGKQDALTELMEYTYGMLTAEKAGLQHKIKSMMDESPTEENEIPEYEPWRDAFDGMDCCSREVQNDNGNDVD